MNRNQRNGWNAYQFEKKRILGSQYDGKEAKEEWANMSPTRRKTYGDSTKLKRDTIHCNINSFLKDINSLGEPRVSLLKSWLSESPFFSLLKMNTGILNSKLVIHLISMFDTSKCSIKIKGVEHTMTAADFTDIMGVRDGDQQFNFSLRALDGLLGKFAEYEGGDEKKPYVCRKKVLDKLRNGDEIDAKRAYNLLALIRVLLPPGRQKLNIKYLDIIDHFENKPWATYAINDMVKCINAYKRGKANVQSHIGGCLLFLQLFYMNKVSLTPPNDTILLHYVTKEMVEKFVKEHEKEHESSSGSAPEGEKEIMEFEYEHIKTMIKGHMVNRVNNIEDQDRKNIVESLYKGILVAFEEHAAETLHHLAISASDHNGSSETHSSFHAEEVQLDDSTENEVDADVETENVAVVQQDVHDDFRRDGDGDGDGDGDVDDVQNKRSKKRRKNEAQVRGTYTMNLRSRTKR